MGITWKRHPWLKKESKEAIYHVHPIPKDQTRREEMKDHKMYRANINGKVVQDQRKRSIILKSSIATTYFFQFSFNLIDYMLIQLIYFITPDKIIEQVFLEKVMTTR